MRPQAFSGSVKLLAAVIMLALVALGGCAPAVQATSSRQYVFWPEQPDLPHVQFLTSIASTGDITGHQSKMDELIYGKGNETDLPFQRPYGVRMFDGRIYVCDATASNVSILDFRKKQVRILGRTGAMTLDKPIDIAVAPDGMKYVADTGLGAVVVFDANDVYAGRIVVPELRPLSLAVHGNELFVSDFNASCVRVFDRLSGKELRTIGGKDSGDPQSVGPFGVAVDGQGDVYIDYFIGCKIRKFTSDGKFLSSFGGLGATPGHFVRPKHMAVDSSGIVYVVDNSFDNVQMFNSENQLLMFFGGGGNQPGAMDAPAGICVCDTDLDLFAPYVHPAFELQRLIIVTNNSGDNKINIYGLGVLKPGKTINDIAPGRVKGAFGFAETPAGEGGPFGATQPESQPASRPATAPATQPAGVPAGGPSGAGKP